MTRFKKMIEGRGGWCEWVFPPPTKNYLMKCCDCGLVHEVQFKAFAEHHQKRGTFQATILPWPIRVMFRARRYGNDADVSKPEIAMPDSLIRKVAREIDAVAYVMTPESYGLKTEREMLDRTLVGAARKIAEEKARRVIKLVRDHVAEIERRERLGIRDSSGARKDDE